MYITQNVKERFARYIDLDDMEFFHQAINLAKEAYLERKKEGIELSDSNIEDIKLNKTPVIFASTISKRKLDETYILRKEMGDRIRRKYLIIDADFNEGEEEKSQELRDRAIQLAEIYQTPLVIYPTASYPSKPRFRLVFFVKRGLNENNYYKAMKWLYDNLGEKATDQSDFRINSNNNAPVFFNDEQLDAIYDTTMQKSLTPLDNMWKDYKGLPKAKRMKRSSTNNHLDHQFIKHEEYVKALSLMKIEDYEEFWKVVYSIIRAEKAGQLSEDQALEGMKILAKSGHADSQIEEWSIKNEEFYRTSKSREASGRIDVTKSKPLLSYQEFKFIILGNKAKEDIS